MESKYKTGSHSKISAVRNNFEKNKIKVKIILILKFKKSCLKFYKWFYRFISAITLKGDTSLWVIAKFIRIYISGMRRTQNKVPWTISMDWKDPMGISNSNGNPNNNYTVL